MQDCPREYQPESTMRMTWNSNSHGARPVHLIITMIKWIRTSRLSIKNALSLRAGLSARVPARDGDADVVVRRHEQRRPRDPVPGGDCLRQSVSQREDIYIYIYIERERERDREIERE